MVRTPEKMRRQQKLREIGEKTHNNIGVKEEARRCRVLMATMMVVVAQRRVTTTEDTTINHIGDGKE